MQSILGNTRKADITFYASGRIDISARVAKHLQLSRGDVLDIMIDQDEFYLYVRLRSPNGTDKKAIDVVNAALEQGLLLLTAKDRVRLLPPLTISKDELDRGVAILADVLSK